LEGSANITPPDADVADVARAILNVIGLPHGTRPFRTHVEPDDGGVTSVNAVGDVIRERYLRRLGCAQLIHSKITIVLFHIKSGPRMALLTFISLAGSFVKVRILNLQ